MERLTKKAPGKNGYTVDSSKIFPAPGLGYTGDAINRLAVFENVYENLLVEQEEIARQLEILRSNGHMKSARYKQLIAKKVTNNEFLFLFDIQNIL